MICFKALCLFVTLSTTTVYGISFQVIDSIGDVVASGHIDNLGPTKRYSALERALKERQKERLLHRSLMFYHAPELGSDLLDPIEFSRSIAGVSSVTIFLEPEDSKYATIAEVIFGSGE